MKTKKNNLTQTETNLISEWKNLGKSNKEIVRRLSRNCSTIGRELKRNGWKKGIYEPLYAQAIAKKEDLRLGRLNISLRTNSCLPM